MKELITRSVTGILFVAATVLPLLYEPIGFLIILGLVTLMAMVELWRMFPGSLTVLGNATVAAVLIAAIFPEYLLLIASVAFGTILLLALIKPEYTAAAAAQLYLIMIPVALFILVLIQSADTNATGVLCFFVVVWTNDTLAYAGGKLIGRTKLAPSVSPGKTVEGTLVGTAAAVALAVALAPQVEVSYLQAGILGFVTAFGAITGDLFESRIKRVAGVKDSGNLLPGHGGVLDRFDAAFGAFPITLFTYMLIQHL
jgi:phosphatidate cytidylyltransferase